MELPSDEAFRIGVECRAWQEKMNGFVDGETLPPETPETISDLLNCYSKDQESPFHKLRPATRRGYVEDLTLIDRTVGKRTLAAVSGRDIMRWYAEFRRPAQEGGKERVSRAHRVLTILRVVLSYGALVEIPECRRLREAMRYMRFEVAASRREFITAQMVADVIAAAHAAGRPSLALAQAMQFELTLRQKDVIGEWVDQAEPGLSLVTWGREKWLRGLRWEEIDQNGILRHTTSKTGTPAEFNVALYPMLVAELARVPVENRRGPMIVDEDTGRPYHGQRYTKVWRQIATKAGVPLSIFNMDSRAGGVTEGSNSGADLESLRHHAQHSNVSVTQRYSRGTLEKTSKVAHLRVKHRGGSYGQS